MFIYYYFIAFDSIFYCETEHARARVELITGRLAEARASIERAWQLVEQNGLKAFIGPWVLGTRALLEEEPEVRLATLCLGRAPPGLDRGSRRLAGNRPEQR
ncbi:hypothetical protein KZO25_13690 [Halomonas sp. ANAO-440]|uniref:hypothetical protein n=1 Tax=Halomonas sp. ANAO-440 TaxID=2861360 RepID=UPI001CAA6DDF|nr:hypothetical protein [Halomonas sp. ANAO-440]MBZ0331367.1 hypothetical protein [Halomonas sp. ANAO-440]